MVCFFEALIQKNKYVNLTSITEWEEAEQKHLIDSLTAYPLIVEEQEKKSIKQEKKRIEVLDVGAGAGFPSIPLAMCLKEVNFTLVESVGKKVDFLESVKESFKLENIRPVKSRIEEFSKINRFDFVLARGVAELNIVCEYGLPFLRVGGRLVAYKAQKAEEEILAAQNALGILGGKIEKKIPYVLTVKGEVLERVLIVIKKTKETDSKYPRIGNKPRLKPL
ncbi:MAG: 16S rRNA (guanine(527)-N(7))-methyltransferase RsmG [Firmicutes bacterium]|nr:16S rRNA (guanine(527)-N(7))-methyltransferase RsmG [Bacillota bacterium]